MSDKVLIKEFGIDKGTSCDTVQLAIIGSQNLTVYINTCMNTKWVSDDWVGQSDRGSIFQWAYESSHSYPVASERPSGTAS